MTAAEIASSVVCAMTQWDYFSDLSAFNLNLADREREATSGMAESVLLSLSNHLHVLNAILSVLVVGNGGDQELLNVLETVSDLVKDLECIYEQWTDIEAGVGASTASYRAPRVKCDGRGRPKVVIEEEKIEFLRELRFNWTQIADIFGVSRRTLYTVRSQYGMLGESSFTDISDQDLQHHVQDIKPEIGYNMMKGVLRSRGIHASISRTVGRVLIAQFNVCVSCF